MKGPTPNDRLHRTALRAGTRSPERPELTASASSKSVTVATVSHEPSAGGLNASADKAHALTEVGDLRTKARVEQVPRPFLSVITGNRGGAEDRRHVQWRGSLHAGIGLSKDDAS